MGRRTRALIALLLPLAGFAFATGVRAEEVRAEVTLVDGRSVHAGLVAIDQRGILVDAEGVEESIPLDDIVSIEFAKGAGHPAARSWVFLSNGDRAPLRPVDLVDDAVVCRWENAGEAETWRVPLELVAAMLRAPIVDEDSTLLSELSTRPFFEDTLILSDGTRLTGALEGIAPEAYRVETAVGSVTVDSGRVLAVGMNAALVQRVKPDGPSAVVSMRDGTWLTLLGLMVKNGGELTGRTGFGEEYRAPLSEVRRMTFYGARVSDVTQREPIEVNATPFVSRRPQMQMHRNTRGGFLQLEREPFARGFGMTSGMAATFALEPSDRQFQATVGIDDCAGDAGSVVFAVELDERTIFTSPMLTGRDAPLVIGPLKVAEGRRLTLRVEFAERGNVQDVANWCDPLLLR